MSGRLVIVGGAPATGKTTLALARSLNALAARIEELLRGEREKASDLVHRLRTPLAALRLEVDMPGDEKMATGRAQVAELTKAIDQLIRDDGPGFSTAAGADSARSGRRDGLGIDIAQRTPSGPAGDS